MARWRFNLPLLLLAALQPWLALAEHSFENTAIVRTVELGGALVHVTTTYAIKALEDGSSVYTLAIPRDEHQKTSWLEVKIKGQSAILPLDLVGQDIKTGILYYAAELPKPLKLNATTNLVVETVQTHATYPWPAEAGQKDPQSLKYETELLVLSPYVTAVQRTKIRTPSPQVHSFTKPEGLEAFTLEDPVTKSGATLTYGPYKNIPQSTSEEFVEDKQKRVTVHYECDFPVIEISKLTRAAEISHWGANLNIEDNIVLHNGGPKLKGHFSRLEHQSSAYFGRSPPHVIPGMTLHLPAGIQNVYYYDLIGNVSTSRLRTAPSVPKGSPSTQFSVLELKPRYPVLGDWNYSFTLGWDSPLRDSAGYDSQTGKWVVAIPVMTPIPSAVIDQAEVKIVLPEGATDFDFYPPFPASMNEVASHITYLDTIGRPTITLHYNQLTDKHSGIIYVTYKVPFSAHMKKPLAVATAFIGVFVLALTWRRVDTRIQRQK